MQPKSSFPPVLGPATRLLVLGSLPGDVSLAQRQYYAHPTNQFWRLISAVIGQEIAAMPYGERLAALTDAGVGLWDVIKTAHRPGSADSDIRGHEPNPLADLVASLPDLRAIAFNGRTSAAIGQRQLGSRPHLALIALPSSSAAYCTISFDRKRECWVALSPYLGR